MRRPRVLSYPPRQHYVDLLHGAVATLVHRDEPWPRLPHFHDPDWLDRHAGDWDLAHFHFTWEQYPVRTLKRVLERHAARGTPVVWTAHDLRNPHTRRAADDVAHLDALAAHASRVTTLTPGAAARIAERWGRAAITVRHPPVLSPDDLARWRRNGRPTPHTGQPLRLFLLAKSLRPNLDWRTPVEVVANWDAADRPVYLDVHLHADAPEQAAVQRAAGDHVRVTVGERLDQQSLCERIVAADVLVLPYMWGTHSGLLELATDLGVQVVATDVGYYEQQAPCSIVPVRDGRVDPARFRAVLRAIAAADAPPPVPASQRAGALDRFRAAHAEIYAQVLRRPGATAS